MEEWKTRLVLNSGDILRMETHDRKGTVREMDIWDYSVVNSAGETVGTVHHEEHTAYRGFKRTQEVIQKDASGKVIVKEEW